jgi:hypothetical protein
VQGVRDVEVSLENDYPEIHVHTEREAAGLVGVTSRSAAQTTLDATLGNIDTPSLWIDPHNGQSYCVFTYYDGPRCRTRARPPIFSLQLSVEAPVPVRWRRLLCVSRASFGQYDARRVVPALVEQRAGR